MSKRPPIGLMPIWLWKELNPNPTIIDKLIRFNQYVCAVVRYYKAGLKIPNDWI